MNRLKLGSLVVVLAAAGVAWFYFGQSDNANETAAKAGSPATAGQTRGGGGPGGGGGRGGRGGPRTALVVVDKASEALVNDRLKAVGSGTAVASVSVVPLSDGILSEVLVTSGQQVAQGDVLARLENDSELISRDRAARNVADAITDEARLARLFQSRTTTEVELNVARADLADAELTLRDAELTLTQRDITAPISGVVGLIAVDQGNYVTTQSEIVTIDDRSTLVLEFWIPERFANQVAPGQQVEARSQANPSIMYQGTISGIGSRIETDSRTLPVQARIDNSEDKLRPGMSFNIEMNFAGETYPAVNPLAIQWDSQGSYVWKVNEDKVQRLPVQIIQRNPESVLVAAELAVGEQVVIEGLLSLRNGATVRIQGAERAREKPPEGAVASETKTASERKKVAGQ